MWSRNIYQYARFMEYDRVCRLVYEIVEKSQGHS